ncbi:MAG: hypothetical protein QXE31_02600 [Candidatus Woesearchaeota archaeon]
MGGGGFYPGAQQGHQGLKHADDHGHVPEEELLKDVPPRAYKLKPHEKKNLEYIEKKLKSGEITKKELHDILHFLEHFSHELKEILEVEREEHIVNMELEKELRKVAQLMGEVSFMLEGSSSTQH